MKRHAETSLRPFRLLTVQQQILLLLVALDLAVTLVFAGVLFSQKKRALMTGIDNKLQAVAVMARELLPPDYHDRITGPESVTAQAGCTTQDLAEEGIVDRAFPVIVARAHLPWQVLGPRDEAALARLIGAPHY